MGDLYNINNNNYNACSSSSSSRDHHHNTRSSDEISHFLQQILLRSSSSTSSPSNSDKRVLVPPPAMMMQSFGDPLRPCPSMGVVKDGILGVDLFDHGGNVMMMGGSSSTGATTGASENENDDCDCESEEGLEGFMDGVPSNTTLPRNSSKRSRAAEVHNLSEKRRRSRINEKMKALQNLIPNSNKTDKASMLDEAIDYLKQLQLQVQMLSMRNGVSLHPMCVPGLLQPFQSSQSRTSFGGESGLRHMNLTASLPLNEDVTPQTMLRPPNQCPPSNQLLVPGMANMINSESTFGLESAIHGNYGQFLHHQASSEGICRGDALPHQHLTSNHPGRDPSDFGIGVATATSSLPYGMRPSNLRDALFLEPCMIGRDQNERVVLKIIEYNLILFPLTLIANNKTFALGVSPYSRLNYSPLAYDLFTSLHTGRSPRSDDTIKMERPANI